MSGEIPAGAYEHAVLVTAAHIDPQGHASNVAILGWLVDAAVAHSAALGFDLAAYRRIGGVFVVRRHEIDYLAPALAGDHVTVHTWPSSIDKATAERCYVAVRDGGCVIARGRTLWAFVTLDGQRPQRIPAELRATFDPAQFV
jgi:acyl-CoA thioester hydrolase